VKRHRDPLAGHRLRVYARASASEVGPIDIAPRERELAEVNATRCHHRSPDSSRRSQRPAGMCRLAFKESHMATNLALDPELLDRAFRVSGEPTKKAAVTRALQEFIARREQRRVAELFGKLDWDTSFDYKAERARKR
jgi:hypothetical protein